MRKVLIVFSLVCLLVVGVCLYVVESGKKQVTMTLQWVPSSWSIVGKPTVPVEQIERVLAWCHSPARGLGQALYDGGVDAGIDPVFPLAFFLHESSCGNAGAARQTHSLGNIICTPGYACIGRFRAYQTWKAGFEDWYSLMRREYIPRGLVTVDAIIPVYAPASDHNDERAYICAIKSAVKVWRMGQAAVQGGCS
jgi:hypothetical protein